MNWQNFKLEVFKALREWPRDNLLRVLAGVVIVVFIFYFFWERPRRQLLEHFADFRSLKEYYELKNAIRATFAQALGGAALLVGVYLTWRNLLVAQRNLLNAQEGQITDRFTRAINQLGESGPEKLAIRLGGIYALERIARDSPRDHWPIMEVLTAYVREKARWDDNPEERLKLIEQSPSDGDDFENDPQLNQPLAADIEAILTVIRRRVSITAGGEPAQYLDLQKTDLHGVYLPETDLRGTNFTGVRLIKAILADANLDIAFLNMTDLRQADLRGASLLGAGLIRADLRQAKLMEADLRGTYLRGATLRKASLQKANLSGVDLSWVDLNGADLSGADLTGADLREVNLGTVQGLTQEQIDSARTASYTTLPPYLRGQAKPGSG